MNTELWVTTVQDALHLGAAKDSAYRWRAQGFACAQDRADVEISVV